MERVPFLVATSEPLRGRRFPVTAQGLLLGREDTCDVVVPGEGVSREHARVIWHNGAVWVRDQGSRNGVFVNDKRVVRHKQVGPGDQVVVGEHSFVLEVVDLPLDPTESISTITASAPLPDRSPPPASPSAAQGRIMVGMLVIAGLLTALAIGVLLLQGP